MSSGGAAGLAHIGVLEELVRAGIDVDCVAGTSAGAMVGAAFASGHLEAFRERVLACSRGRRTALFDPIWPRSGLFEGRRTMELLGPCAAGAIEDLPMRFAAIATDLDSGRSVVLQSGDLWGAIRASIAIPGVFTPHHRAGRLLVDGALLDPVPVGAARELGATFVIAVSVIGSEGALVARRGEDVSASPLRRLLRLARRPARLNPPEPAPEPARDGAEATEAATERSDGLAAILCKASAVVQTTIAAARLRESPPDFLIAPATHDIGVFEVRRAAEAIDAGRAAARAALPDLRLAIERTSGEPRRWWDVRATGDRDAA